VETHQIGTPRHAKKFNTRAGTKPKRACGNRCLQGLTSCPAPQGNGTARSEDWTPRELRHSFVPVLSDSGIRLEEISRLVSHKNSVVTELIYRKQIRPVLQHGAGAVPATKAKTCAFMGGRAWT
jgi:integrase